MRSNLMSFLAAFTLTLSVFASIIYFKPAENMAYASNVVGSAFQNLNHSAEKTNTMRVLRQRISAKPEALIDVKGLDARLLFGQPELIRRDVPTTIWQYRNDSCVLDLFFTTQKSSAKDAPIVHYELRARSGDDLGAGMEKRCLRTLARANSGFHFVNVNAAYKAD